MRVAIFGAAGYGGIELVRLLAGHPETELTYLADPAVAGKSVAQVFPHLSGCVDLTFEAPSVPRAVEAADLVFYCLQPGLAMDMVAETLEAGLPVIDFSADFRLASRDEYEHHYDTHRRPELLEGAAYGLPELHRDEIASSNLIAVPGCYPTSAILALAPLVAAGAVQPDGMVVSSVSGASGLGRRASLPGHFPECNEDARAYGIGTHRHTPEMEQELEGLAGADMDILFVPHLIPITRGIVTTAYAKLTGKATTADLLALYHEFYKAEPFVRVRGEDESVAAKPIQGTNFCDVSVRADARTGRAVALGAVDNLGKGLSSAAVQCMNVRFGIEETAGLEARAIWP